jgi:hypothetical protein
MIEAQLKTLLDGGRYYEAPRWHRGRLWFVDCMARTLLSVGPSGDHREHATFADDTPCGYLRSVVICACWKWMPPVARCGRSALSRRTGQRRAFLIT